VLKVDYPQRGDSYPPVGETVHWELYLGNEVAPSLDYVDIKINYQTTCNPTQGPTPSPSAMPTVTPTKAYLCVIITWDLGNKSYSNLPTEFYGAYYYRTIDYPLSNDFSKFPMYPSFQNGKPIFTKKRNSNSIRYFLGSESHSNENAWVIDSDVHDYQLVSSRSNEDSEFPI